jgi:hypothetical protein
MSLRRSLVCSEMRLTRSCLSRKTSRNGPLPRLTNDDEDNIMAGQSGQALGCKRVVALINRRAYAEMIEGGPIDIGISPAQVSIGTLLAHVRQGDVAEVHSLRRGAPPKRLNWSRTAMPKTPR